MIPQRLGFTAAHFAAFLFGLTGVLGALINSTPILITFGRALFAVLALGLAALLLRIPIGAHINRHTLKTLVMAGLSLAIHWVTFFIAIKIGGVALATLGFASFPAFITLLERFFLKEKIGQREWFLLLLVLIGLLLVTPSTDLASASTLGLGWGIISGFAFAVLAVINRKSTVNLDPVQVAFWQNLVVTTLTLPFIFILGDISMLTPKDYAWLAVLGILCTALSHYLFVFSLRTLTARTTGLIIALEPVYAIVIAWILFAEAPTLRMIIGGALIITAAVFPKAAAPLQKH